MRSGALADLVPVILAGGSGTRLWPVSRAAFPKHLVELTGESSLLQATASRLLALASPGRFLTVAAAGQAILVRRQLALVDPALATHLLLEPAPRNTAAAVALAALYARDAWGGEALLWICPSDHLIADPAPLRAAVVAGAAADAIGALAHYIVLVSLTGSIILIAGYALAVLRGGLSLAAFARAMLPVHAVAISTQSSLASLPAMLGACRRLGVRESTADFVLPLAVAIFRATSPAMNMAVAIYAAKLTGTPLTPATLAAGIFVAFLVSLSSVSLPGTLSFVVSVGPIALAMGVPVAPLALLVAVEMLPDLMRTIGNVTMDVAVTATVDRKSRDR